MLRVSVIICSHNPREDYLRRALDALKVQTLPQAQWELVLIDNASAPPLAPRHDMAWHLHGRHIREETLGLTASRLRGIRETTAPWLVFVDDDNLLAPDYLETLLALVDEHPKLGCMGAGLIEPEFETIPDPSLEAYLPCLALRSITRPAWSNDPRDGLLPWGAGLAAIREVADTFRLECEGSLLKESLGRRGESLVSGEDNEFSWAACALGYGKGIFQELRLTHLIPSRRVERDYLLKLVEGQAFSDTILAHLHGQTLYWPPPPSALRDVVQALLRAKLSTALHHLNLWQSHRHKPEVESAFESARRRGADRARRHLGEQKP
jgi:glycosyltransferase involved in cell wall biosynthesis